METTINIAKRKEAIKILKDFKENHYKNRLIQIINVHLKNVNDFYGKKIFLKDDCVVESDTLWEIMQPLNTLEHHHSHDLDEKEIFNVLFGIKKPLEVKESYYGRFVIITIVLEKHGYNLCAVIQPNVLNKDLNKKINKLITIYPFEIKKEEHNSSNLHFSTLARGS